MQFSFYSLPNFLWVLPGMFALNMAEIVLFLIMGKLSVCFAYLRAYYWNVINLSSTLEKRQWVQSRRKVSDRDIMYNMYRGSAKIKLLLEVGIPKFG